MIEEKTLKISSINNEYQIPAILTIPEQESKVPVVILLHGTASDKHEVGNGYDRLAEKLALHHIASIRFDFIGQGESDVDYKLYSLTRAVEDVLAVKQYVDQNEKLDSERIGAVGWSQGGTIAMLAAAKASFKSIVTWAGALNLTGLFDDKMLEIARKQGYYTMHWDFRSPTDFGLEWFEEVLQTDVSKVFRKYQNPVLAIAGSNDDVVDPENAKIITKINSNPKSKYQIIENADHVFNTLAEDTAAFDTLSELTVQWFSSLL